MSGLFISFEGGEGAGKTTQIQFLKERLQEQGLDVISSREPGGTPEAEKIRELLVHREGGDWDPLSECLLFFTARRMHIEKLIKPALEAGKVVICDRFTDSTIAYQGYGHGFDLTLIDQVRELCIYDFYPDLTFLLDIPAKLGLQRSTKRLSGEGSEEDRFEQLTLSFHEKLRQGFLEIARQEPERCHVIDATQTMETIGEEIWAVVRKKLK
jgi:dTMP kinase